MQKALCCFDHNRTLTWQKAVTFSGYFMLYFTYANVKHPKYYKHLKKGDHQSHQKMVWFLAD